MQSGTSEELILPQYSTGVLPSLYRRGNFGIILLTGLFHTFAVQFSSALYERNSSLASRKT